jgi:hypothetical protein
VKDFLNAVKNLCRIKRRGKSGSPETSSFSRWTSPHKSLNGCEKVKKVQVRMQLVLGREEVCWCNSAGNEGRSSERRGQDCVRATTALRFTNKRVRGEVTSCTGVHMNLLSGLLL